MPLFISLSFKTATLKVTSFVPFLNSSTQPENFAFFSASSRETFSNFPQSTGMVAVNFISMGFDFSDKLKNPCD